MGRSVNLGSRGPTGPQTMTTETHGPTDDPGGRFPGSLGRERETPAGGGIPRDKGNMTDE